MANIFSGDSSCKALWRFENGALTTDSVSTNTLTAVNTPVADTTNYLEGAASVDLERTSSQYLYRADADLTSGFPLKSDDTTKLISVFVRVKVESMGASQWIYSKTNSGTVQRSWGIYLTTTGLLECWCGYNSGKSSQEKSLGYTLSTGVWYSIGIACDGINKTILVRVYDHTADEVVHSTTVTFTNELYAGTAAACVGCKADPLQYFDGLIDELVIFNALKSTDDFDAMIAGTYGSDASSLFFLHG